MSDTEFDGLLDLSGADGKVGFEAIPAGKYEAHVHNAEYRTTSGQGKLPEGTPYLNVQIKVDQEFAKDGTTKVQNRVVFGKLFVPPSGYDQEKSMRMKNSMVNFLTSVGYEMSEIQSKKFRIDPDDLIGRQCVVVVNRFKNDYTDEWDNNVQGFKPAGTAGEATTAGSGALL